MIVARWFSIAGLGFVFFTTMTPVRGMAATSASGLLVIRDNPERPWTAGSRPTIHVRGAATKDAVRIRYRWLGQHSWILAQGMLARDPRGGFSGAIEVPRFSARAAPKLNLEIDRANGEAWIFSGGHQFDIPRLQGLMTDSSAPEIRKQSIEKGQWGQRIEMSVRDASGIAQALLVLRSSGAGRVVRGQCRGQAREYVCAFLLPPTIKPSQAVVQLTNLVGNRTIASVRGGK